MLAVLCARFIATLGAFLVVGCTSLFLEAEGCLDVVLDEDGGDLVFFGAVAASDGGGLAYTTKERIFLVVERVVAGIVSSQGNGLRWRRLERWVEWWWSGCKRDWLWASDSLHVRFRFTWVKTERSSDKGRAACPEGRSDLQ